MEPTVEDTQRLMVSEQHVDDMVQFQAGPITNMIPNLDRQKEYRKKKLHELTVQEREEQRKWNVDHQRAFRERKSNQLEEKRNQFADQQKKKMSNDKDKFQPLYQWNQLWKMLNV